MSERVRNPTIEYRLCVSSRVFIVSGGLLIHCSGKDGLNILRVVGIQSIVFIIIVIMEQFTAMCDGTKKFKFKTLGELKGINTSYKKNDNTKVSVIYPRIIKARSMRSDILILLFFIYSRSAKLVFVACPFKECYV